METMKQLNDMGAISDRFYEDLAREFDALESHADKLDFAQRKANEHPKKKAREKMTPKHEKKPLPKNELKRRRKALIRR